MGIGRSELAHILPSIEAAGYDGKENVSFCELGNNYIERGNENILSWLHSFAPDIDVPMGGEQHSKGIASKRFWEAIGFNHVSIDLNGLDGALSYDLREDINKKYNYKEQFDIVYEGGTVEHVSNQYWAFKNTHNLTKKGGTMIHILPKVGFWENHCSYFYTIDSFSKLAELCSYKVQELREIDPAPWIQEAGPMIYTRLEKTDNKDFIDEKAFEQVPITFTGWDANDKSLYPNCYK